MSVQILKLTDRQQKVVEYVKQEGSITNLVYQNVFSVSRATAFRDLKKLIEGNILVQDGRGHTTKYRLK